MNSTVSFCAQAAIEVCVVHILVKLFTFFFKFFFFKDVTVYSIFSLTPYIKYVSSCFLLIFRCLVSLRHVAESAVSRGHFIPEAKTSKEKSF